MQNTADDTINQDEIHMRRREVIAMGTTSMGGRVYEITFTPYGLYQLWLVGAKKSRNFGFPRGSWSRVGKSFNSKLLLVSCWKTV